MKTKIVDLIIERIKPQFELDSSGHDFHHIERVLNLSRYLHQHEGGDLEIIELAALLHDISDHKFNGNQLNQGGVVASKLLLELNYDPQKTIRVAEIIDDVSYKGALTPTKMESIEGQIVQDADRLDAIGAIGIGRTFAYGGFKGQAMYDPSLKAKLHSSFDEYAHANSNTINHFYEKLLLLTDRLNTRTAIKIGEERHRFMELFLETFLKEWHFNQTVNE